MTISKTVIAIIFGGEDPAVFVFFSLKNFMGPEKWINMLADTLKRICWKCR